MADTTPEELRPPSLDPERLAQLNERLRNSARNVAAVVMDRAMLAAEWGPYWPWGDKLVGEGFIVTPSIKDAMNTVKRYDFVPDNVKDCAGSSGIINIGYNQTNSMPRVVSTMLEFLRPAEGQKVLDVGSGSGWTTALLAHIVKDSGRVIGTERIPELTDMGQTNLSKYSMPWSEIRQAGEVVGCPEEAPYDRILVSARTPIDQVPILAAQLNENGLMVVPIETDVDPDRGSCDLCVVKPKIPTDQDPSNYEVIDRLEGFSFVPLLGAETNYSI